MKKRTIVAFAFHKRAISNLCVYFDFFFFIVTLDDRVLCELALSLIELAWLYLWTNFNRCMPSYLSVLLLTFIKCWIYHCFVLFLHSGHEFYDFSQREENKARMSKNVKEIIF